VHGGPCLFRLACFAGQSAPDPVKQWFPILDFTIGAGLRA